MDPILTSAWRLWDAWAIRILLLLSFALQVILSLFGNHRKYTTSLWISVLVWVAYLNADWVATMALSKVSDAEGNILRATWATLLLLHLGGTDNITAYSLEDNQLWMRQLMGFMVQTLVAIYVIGISWNNSWFSFMSLPAFIAGIAKYWVRTEALKWVSDKKYIDTIRIDDLGRNYFTGVYNEYVQVLVVAHIHLKAFMKFLKNRGTYNVHRLSMPSRYNDIESRIMWDALEVKMGLMYDVLYTNATQVYSKWGFLSRCCIFGCANIVCISIIIVHYFARGNLVNVDFLVTLVLIVGALILENYAAFVGGFSNWAMLREIKVGKRHRVIWLSERFPRLFNKGKNWSNKMGQFDLLGYWLRVRVRETDVRGLSRKRIRLVLGRIIRSVFGCEYEKKWNIYLHKTMIPVRPSVVYNAILDLWDLDSNYRRLFFLHDDDHDHDGQLRDIWDMLDQSSTFGGAFQAKIMCLHLATTLCYHRETETNDGSKDREVSKALSDYMMYLLIVNPSLYPIDGSDMFSMNPSLFPNDGSETLVENIDYLDSLIGNTGEVRGACDHLLTHGSSAWCGVVTSLVTSLERINEQETRWEIMKLMWWRMLQTAASDPKIGGIHQKDAHFQGLSQGGELLTFIWFYYSPYVEINRGEDRTGKPQKFR